MLEQLGGQIGQNQPLVRSTAAEACALGGCGHVLSCSRSANSCGGSRGSPLCSAGVQGGRPLALREFKGVAPLALRGFKGVAPLAQYCSVSLKSTSSSSRSS